MVLCQVFSNCGTGVALPYRPARSPYSLVTVFLCSRKTPTPASKSSRRRYIRSRGSTSPQGWTTADKQKRRTRAYSSCALGVESEQSFHSHTVRNAFLIPKVKFTIRVTASSPWLGVAYTARSHLNSPRVTSLSYVSLGACVEYSCMSILSKTCYRVSPLPTHPARGHPCQHLRL